MSKILIFDLHKFPNLVNLPAVQTAVLEQGSRYETWVTDSGTDSFDRRTVLHQLKVLTELQTERMNCLSPFWRCLQLNYS